MSYINAPIACFSNASILFRVRNYLIKKLAGNSLVILNARITLIKDDGYACRLENSKSPLICNSSFPCTHGLILKMEGNI